jgi:NADH dehydrogenase/NADH:ubiquinone oxidoreductase subunit G
VDDSHPDVVYEPGKCIACGICVRIAAEAREGLGLGFVGRAFHVRTAVPFNSSMVEGLREVALACADACPTGALVRRG